MTLKALIALLILFCVSCTNHFDSLSGKTFKETPLNKSEVQFRAQIWDAKKGYWTFYGTKDFRLHISHLDTIPSVKGQSHYYVADYWASGDTLKMAFRGNHVPPALEYVMIRRDSFFMKTTKFSNPIPMELVYFK